jgi:hypothetical protein
MKMQTTTTASCASCQYWNVQTSTEGECRRRAPQTIAFKIDENVKFESRFPVTEGSDWCGEFEAK